MDKEYSLNDLALMTGFSTRTLRNYMNHGLLKGEKANGIWQFGASELDRFFREPFVKEGLRIKHNSAVFDFLSDRIHPEERTCVILDIPASAKKGHAISVFFCDKMNDATDAHFTYGWDNGVCRVILTGDAESIAEIMKAYYAERFDD